jgi:hypothetical protein
MSMILRVWLLLACAMLILPAHSATESGTDAYFGASAGLSNSSGTYNTFIGGLAGASNTAGSYNTYVGDQAGYGFNGIGNTFVGYIAGGGYSTSGSDNVFIGLGAGYSEIGSNRLYIDNCMVLNCLLPFIYGEFDNHVLKINGVTHVSANVPVEAGTLHTYTVTATWTSGSNVVNVSSTAGLEPGSAVTASVSGIPAGTTIAIVGATTITLSAAATASQTNQSLTLSSNVITGLSSTFGMVGGQPVSGTGIPAGSVIGTVDSASQVSLNKNATTNGPQTLTFGSAQSELHFSLNGDDSGGFLTSVLENNFFTSSGARYDGINGGWIQRSSDTKSVMAGSGGVGYRIFTSSGHAVGTTFTPTLRLHIDYNGQFGFNTAPVAGDEIHTSSGAHLTSGGVWTDASSRSYKEHIAELSAADAVTTLDALTPVTYNYKADSEEKHVGFIAEDVPDLVATKDRTSLAPMDIVAVLTKVVQQQRQTIDDQRTLLERQGEEVRRVEEELAAVLHRLESLESRP